MAHDALGSALRRIGRAAGPADGRPDAELVAAFVAARCDAAFAELVARHGPVVLGTCRRILGNAPDADDAFQATFLVLARKAASIRPPGAVGAWLYGVAWKVATKAKGLAAKRAARDRLAAKPEAVADPMTDPTLRPLLDAELARIPDALRTAVVLCDLGGKTRAEAARELGWPEGTVATRLAKGRAALAERLARRGFTLTVAGLTAAIAPTQTSAAVPTTLFESTLTATAAGVGLTPAAVALANGATRAMTLAKLFPVAAAVFAGALMVAGAAAIPGPKSSNGNQPPAASRVDPPAAPAAKAEEPSGWKETTAVSLTGWLPGSLAYAPDGKSLVIGGTNGHVRVIDAATRDVKWEKTLDGKLTGVAVSPDGKAVAATIKDGVQLFDAATGVPGLALEDKDSSPTAVGFFPDTHLVGPQGQLTSHKVVFGGEKGYAAKSWIDGGAPGTVKTSTSTKDSYAVPLAVDPNGQHAVMTGPVDPKTGRNVLWAYACGGQGGNHVLVGHGSPVVSAAWSADGKTIVTGDAVGIIIVWDAGTFKEKESGRFFLAGRVAGVAVSADGRRIAAALVSSPPVEQRVLVWTVGTKSLRQVHDELVGGPFQGIAGLAFSPDGTELAAGFCNVTHLSRSGRLEGKVRFWKLDGKDSLPAPAAVWKEVAFTGDHAKAASSLAVSPDGSTLVTGGFDNHVAVWDAATAKLRSDFQVKDSQGDGLAVAFRPDGKLIAVATRTSSVALYDPVKGNAARIDGQASWAGGATTLAFSPDGTKLAAMGGKVLRVIDTTKPGVETTRPGDDLPPVPTRPILTDLTWSADGKYFHDFRRVAKGGTWALTTRGADGEPKSRLHDTSNAITCLAQASDMESMAQGKADGTVAFSTAKNRSNGTIPAPPGPGSTVRAVRFTPDANKLAVVYDELDGRNSGLPYASSIRIYDLTVVGRFPELGVVTLKDRLVYDFATSADGTTIAVVSIDPADINSPKPKATDLRLWRRP